LALSLPSVAQLPAPGTTEQVHSQIAALAERLAAQVGPSSPKKLVVLDFTLPNHSSSPVGSWLAAKVIESLAPSHPQLQLISGAKFRSTALQEPAHDENEANSRDEQSAGSVGAEFLVRGNFAAISDGKGIGITLTVTDVLTGGHFEILGELPLTPEMKGLLTSPLPERTDLNGFYKASIAGIGLPTCLQCPPPAYSYMAQARKLSGLVVLEVSVSQQGKTANIKVVRSPNAALANAAIRTVSLWQFRPASNAQGNPVPAIVNVAVTFRPNAKTFSAAKNTPAIPRNSTRSSSTLPKPASPLP
jgi:TonB family protein